MLFDYDDTEWLTKCIWEFSVVGAGFLMIKYATYSWSNSVNNAQSVFFLHDEHGVCGHDDDDHDAQKRLCERNQQLMPSIPKSYVWSITNTLNIIRMLFFQLVRVVIIIYKKYISVIQNISSKTWERRFNG